MKLDRDAEDASVAQARAPSPRRRALLATVAALLAAGGGCAAVAASRSAPGALAGGAFTPARAGAAQYGPDPGRTCPAGGAFKILEDDLAGVRPQPKGDGRLCAAADTLLGWSQSESPPESVVSFVAWHFGLPGPVPRVAMANLETEDVRVIAERLGDQVKSFSATAVEPRFGLATDRVRKDVTKVVLLMQDMAVEVAPVPRRLAQNAQAPLGGRLQGDVSKPQVLVSNATGKLESTSPQTGNEFTTELRCGDRPGRMQVEVRGVRNGAPAVLARFPVYCAAEPPVSVAAAPPEKGPVDAGGAERKLFQLMNAERATGGIAPLAWDDAVAGVARGASQSFRDEAAKGSGHFDVVARLKQVDVSSLLVLENPVLAPTPEEAQARLVSSPLHRANLMNPEATHAGVGIVPSTDAGGAAVYVTELLVRELPPVDAEAVRAKLRAAIARKRADARAQPLASDPMLEDLAQRYAQELAAAKGALPKPRADALVAPLYKSFRNVNVLSGAKAEPLDFAEEPGVAGPGKVIGLGVAQGANAVLGKNAVYVVIFVGARR